MAVDAFAEGSCGQLLSFPFCKIATQKRGLLPLSGSLFLHSHVAKILQSLCNMFYARCRMFHVPHHPEVNLYRST